MTNLVEVPLHRLAHARSGDKGNRLNIALVCRDPSFYQLLAEQLTTARVAEIFAGRQPSAVVRYELPKLSAFNFVLDGVLEGGVNASLGLDGHGKSLSQVPSLLWFALFHVPRSISRNRSVAGARRPACRRTTPIVRETSGFRIGRVTMMG